MPVQRRPRRPHRPHRAAALCLLLLACAATSCGYGSKADGPTGGQVPAAAVGEKLSAGSVRIGHFPNLTHATALVGVREGLIQKELGGTTLKTVTFNAGPAEIEALNAGAVDIGFIGPSPAINGYVKSKGSNLRIISGSASGGVKLVVNPERIKTLDDLKGRRIATPQLGNTQDVALLNWIAARGWKVDAASGRGDVSVVRTDNTITPDAYRSGAVDGAWVPEPTASKLVAEGGRVLLDERDLWPGGRFVITNVIVSQKFLKEHPDVVEAVLRGTVRTNEWINADPDRAKASANAALKSLTGKELDAEVIDRAWPGILVTDDPLAATLRAQAGHAVTAGLLERPDLTGIHDLGPLNKVLGSLRRPPVTHTGPGIDDQGR
ncbi:MULTISPECIES: aliphatic sulfonate ABC transporter substrate-binding protein [unclassified Streptomyces]|uniref:aliphatic sulfonate ABC transporter substrate-binding protein n=1 Tax=unclassified Streptomyces TaxID=2593676 RepID=UPI0029A86EFF|nr:aliphatic sulfonate ABC transporter substrate-binding protein [Streptomyces sp. DK15]MDX2393629.1 aliphatic sulfonate ABC transporter substrate-binding protein [Streptomyces sp. DK15]